MLGTTETVIAYYLGIGFVILLSWAACHPDRQLDHLATARYLRWTIVAAVIGVLHPALALAARDIVGQVGVELPDDDPGLRRRQQRAARVTNVLTWLSLIPLGVVVAMILR